MKEAKMIIFQCLLLLLSIFNQSNEACPCTSTPATPYCFNGECYSQCPDDTKIDLANPGYCKCKYRYYTDSSGHKICLAEGESCPSSNYQYYFSDSKECKSLSSCGASFFERKVTTSDQGVNIHCVSTCNDDEVKLYSTTNKCLKTCKVEINPYYYPENRTCISDCGSDYTYVEQGTCHAICETPLNTFDSSTTPKLKCSEQTSCSNTAYPYLYLPTKTCFHSCTDTSNIASKVVKQTYTFEDSSTKRCVSDCALTTKPFISSTGNECVSSCPSEQIIVDGKCKNGNYCYSETDKYQIDGSFECIGACPYDYYLLTDGSTYNICYQKCPVGYYHDHSAKKCVKFTPSTNFIVLNDETQTLYSECPPTAPYYIEYTSTNPNPSAHKCFYSPKGCADTDINPDPSFIYSTNSAPYVCISSCPSPTTKLITEDFKCLLTPIDKCPLSYPYRNETICYKNGCPEDMDYYVNDNKEKICYSLDIGCPIGFNYIQNKKCVKACNVYEYPYTIKSTGTGSNLVYGYCFESLDGCFNKGYYYFDGTTQVKECKNTLSGTEIIIQNDTDSNAPYRREQGTIVVDCPSDFPYKSGNICYRDKCPSGTYANYTDIENSNLPIDCLDCNTGDYKFIFNDLYCTDNCLNTTDHYTEGNKCKPQCPSSGQKYFYLEDKICKTSCNLGHAFNPITFECLNSSCLDVPDYPFYPNISETDQPAACQKQCDPTDKYYEPRKKCYNDCNGDPERSTTANYFYSSSDNKRCVESCETWEFVGNDSVCTTECKATDFYYIGTDKQAHCVADMEGCTGVDNTLVVYSGTTHQCLKECPKLESYQYNDTCYQKCPSWAEKYTVLSSGVHICNTTCVGSDDEYSIEGSNQCYKECPQERNFVVNGTYLCLEHCPKDFPFYFLEGTNSHYTCVSSCVTVGKVQLDEKCVDSCGINGYKKYLYVGNNLCVSRCPDDVPYFENVQNANYSICRANCEEGTKKYAIQSTKECIEDCPYYAPYIGKSNICKRECDTLEDGDYSYLVKTLSNPDYNISKCLKKCSDSTEFKYTLYGMNLCSNESCPDGYNKAPNDICYISCADDPQYSFTVAEAGECVKKCNASFPNYYSNKTCVDGCTDPTSLNKTIDENKACVLHCHYDEDSKSKFASSTSATPICVENCSLTNITGETKYSKKDYLCLSKCPEDEPFERVGGECSKTCDLDSPYKFAVPQNETGTYKDYKCEAYCPPGMVYYEEDYICLENCTDDKHEGYNLYDGTASNQKCVKFCPEGTAKYIKENSEEATPTYNQSSCLLTCLFSDMPFTLENNECAMNCSKINKFYFENEKKCMASCPGKYNNNPDNLTTLYMCVNECPTDYVLTDIGTCEKQCRPESGFIYYFETDRICRQSCGSYYVNEYNKTCGTYCPDSLPYANDTMCVDQCPDNKKYVIYSFDHGEVEIQRKCLNDCPKEYPYFAKFKDVNGNTINGCFSTCEKASTATPPDGFTDNNYAYYISDKDPLVSTKKCVQKCDRFISEEVECIEKCPTDKPYYDSGKNCYASCPLNESIHEIDSFICKQNCTDPEYFVDYETNICVRFCKPNQKWGQVEGEPKYCLDECNTKFGTIETNDYRCVGSCTDAGNDYLMDPNDSNKCQCKNLFYHDEGTGLIKCMNNTIESCVDALEILGMPYKYTIVGTKECSSICKTLSTGDFQCLSSDAECPENSYKYRYPDGSSTCKCQYKYYYKGTTGQKICLGEFENCPSGYNTMNVVTKECFKGDCPTGYKSLTIGSTSFKYCFESCPTGYLGTGVVCECASPKRWYKKLVDGEYQFYCFNSENVCNEEYQFFISDTKECVKSCMNSEEDSSQYYILDGKTCVSSCSSGTKIALSPNDPLYQYSHYTCRCSNIWFYSDSVANGVLCETNPNKKCRDYDGYYFEIKETHECVRECPADHPYVFNDACYKQCSQAKVIDSLNLQLVANTTECFCDGAWKYTDGNKTLVDCKPLGCEVGELQIEETKECIEGAKCPPGYLKFNNLCYKDKCPSNSAFDSTKADECSCLGLWYYTDPPNDTVKYCMGENDKVCPISNLQRKYKIINTNQCTNETVCLDNDLYIFNYECYYKDCPEKTKKNDTDSHFCECDETYGYWYHEMKEDDYLTCSLDNCPENKRKIVNGTKECVHDCNNLAYRYHMINVCYQSGCPDGATDSPGVDIIKECQVQALDNCADKSELAELVKKDLDLYYTRDTKSDFVHKNPVLGVNLQIYAVNKDHMEDAEGLRRSDLSYLDLNQCINKIYSQNALQDSENVIIVKYDILDTSKAYMINSVEYELYSSNGYKKLDPSACDAKSLVVSYPITYTVNKFNGQEKGEYNTYKKVFNLAKELIKENEEYDVYNNTSPIYKDPCISCEIDGKDLVLEDRAKYLYPSSSICENNCTYNSTDFFLERINCICAPKEEFDINRNQPSNFFNFSIDELKDNQGGSSNLPVLTCLSKLDQKDKIAKNGGFYYMVFATAIEIGLTIVSFVIGYGKTITKIGTGLQIHPALEAGISPSGGDAAAAGTGGANPPPKDGQGVITNYAPNSQQTDNNMNSNNQLASNNNNNNNNDIINIRKISPKKKRRIGNNDGKLPVYDEKPEEEEDSESESGNYKEITAEGLFQDIRDEQRIIRFSYSKSSRIDISNALTMILAQILDKIYLTRTLFFLRKYDIFSAFLSLYFFYHVLLVVIIAFFFDIKTIKKIWEKDDFPTVGWYLGYGLLSNLIVWIAYRMLGCLLSNNDKIEGLIYLKYNVAKRQYYQNKKGCTVEELLYQKYEKVKKQIKTKMIIYYILLFVFFIFAFIYLTVFCGIYTGTKKRVFKCYGISILEVLIIKIVYGIILGALRKASINSKIKWLYNITRYCNIYLS